MISAIKSDIKIQDEKSLETFSLEKRALSTRDQVLADSIRLSIREDSKSIDLEKPKSTAELMILFTDLSEDLKTRLLKSDIDHQRDLHETMVDTQKKFQELLKKKRDNASTAAEIAYFEKIATGFLSALSITVGGMMVSSLLPPFIYGGSFLIGSGALSLSALALESLGASESITKPISFAGMLVGMAATAVGAYLNPGVVSNSAFAALQASKAIFSGVNTITQSETERKSLELEAELSDERKKQEMQRLSQDKIMSEILDMVSKLNVSEQASKMIAQQQELSHQYIKEMVQQRG